MGNLTRAPEVRMTPGQGPFAEFGLAVSRRYRSAAGLPREERCFLRVTAWGGAAEAAARSLGKGSAAYVEGRLRYDESKREPGARDRIYVQADRLSALGPARRDELADLPPSEEPGAPPPPDPAGSGDPDDLPF